MEFESAARSYCFCPDKKCSTCSSLSRKSCSRLAATLPQCSSRQNFVSWLLSTAAAFGPRIFSAAARCSRQTTCTGFLQLVPRQSSQTDLSAFAASVTANWGLHLLNSWFASVRLASLFYQRSELCRRAGSGCCRRAEIVSHGFGTIAPFSYSPLQCSCPRGSALRRNVGSI